MSNRKLYEAVPLKEWQGKNPDKHYSTQPFADIIGIGNCVLVAVEDEWVSELPNDDECAEWYNLNIGNDPEKPCSASSAIYKFRGWLNERSKHSSYQRILDAATRLLKWYDDESEKNPHSTEEWSNAYEELRTALPQPPSQTNKPE